MTNTPRNYWMMSVTPSYFEVVREKNLTIAGLTKAHKKRVQRMEIGDRLIYFISGVLVFPGIVTITDTYFVDENELFPETSDGELFPYRIRTKKDYLLPEDRRIDARLIAPRLEYLRKWSPEKWPLAFQGLLHLVPKADFLLLETEIKRARRKKNPLHPIGKLEPKGEDYDCEFDRMASKVY